MKVKSLTKEQEAKLATYREEGIKIGMDTRQGDIEEIKHHIQEHRKLVGLKPVETWDVLDSPMAAMEKWKSVGISPSNAFYGQHDINWLQFYMFFRNECGLTEETNKIVHLYALAKLTGWFWMSETQCIITKKPVAIRTKKMKTANNQWMSHIKVLHNPGGLALEYADGKGVYALDGRRLTSEYDWIIKEPARVTLQNLLAIKNTDIRASALKLLPSQEIVKAPGVNLVDTASFDSYHSTTQMPTFESWDAMEAYCKKHYKKVTSHYKLVELQVGEQTRRYLEMTCPSKGEVHVEAVHPDCTTVAAALGWKENPHLPITNTYIPPLVRT